MQIRVRISSACTWPALGRNAEIRDLGARSGRRAAPVAVATGGEAVLATHPAGGADALGQAQLIMMRKAMDMALNNNAKLLSSMPPAPNPGQSGTVDVRA